ncbi:histidine--tRNA ligase [Agrococcus jejuensis]|uniref:Histidyl-tRNA synthetase n=1 Tax=Agrococcus jejuensis TaxID=399736 RepID=A0A1G8FP63_9MICO|nr:ATP phosphoribosyltransferase regulatory subunit [Agrococcus jejuensis]SDH83973.1 histidyl-tRNA synthetase [Agrococcus jejuensis]
MASQVNPPRGMRDMLPAEQRRRAHVADVIRGAFSDHGFEEIETPVVELAERLHAGLGGDNEKLAFGIQRRGLTVDDLRGAESPADLNDLGLRFDLTVPLARYYATNRAELPTVFRSIQIAPVWRAERPQAGRYRQFVQCDIDIVGEPGIQAELELVAATGDALQRLGLADAFVRVNDRRILHAMLEAAGVADGARDGALITIDKLDKIGRNGVATELDGHGIDGAAVLAQIDAVAAGDWSNLPDEATEAIRTLLAVDAADLGVRLELDPSLVRGMGYYTGVIMEIAHPAVPYSIGGGGRYDGMVGRFLGTDVPAAGISFGFERLIDLVDLSADADEEVVGILHDRDVTPAQLVAAKRRIVASGRAVRVAKRTKNVARVLDALAASGATHVLTLRADADPAGALDVQPVRPADPTT